MLVRWSEDCSVLRSSSDWQLVLLDRGETVHQLHGLVHAPGQGRVNVVFLPTVSGKKPGGFQWAGCLGTS